MKKNNLYILCGALFFCHCKKKQPNIDPVSINPIMISVPDAVAAKKIALEVWQPMYGEKVLADTPFVCQLKDSIWVVEGTLSGNKKGGVPYIHIGRHNGKIYLVGHSK